MTKIDVDFGQLALAGQLLDRQADHLGRIDDYVVSNCRLEAGDLGLILRVLHPLNEAVVDLSGQATGVLTSLTEWAADATRATLTDYLEAEQSGQSGFGSVQAAIDAMPQLKGPESGAHGSYGQDGGVYLPIDIDVLIGAGQVAQEGGIAAVDTATTLIDRLSTLGDRGGVSERTDPTSYLVPPQSHDNFVEDLRWNAGLLIGGVDWVAEKFIGVSILKEYILKPFGGDWDRIGDASTAWTHGGRALMELGSNYSGLPGQLATWRGDGATAFLGAMTGMSAAAVGLSYAFDAVSGAVSAVSTAARLACVGIAAALKWISNKLMRLAAEAAVPVVGWAVGAVEAIEAIEKVIFYIRLINTLINTIFDAISAAIAGREKLAQALFMVEDLANAAATKAVRA
ncbi:hypothetical protein ACWKWP_01745 [Agromyces soli]